MPSLNYSIEDVRKFLSVLTWKKIIQLIVFLFIMGLTWATYENRGAIYGFASQKRIDPTSPHVRELSKGPQKEIGTVVEKSASIVAMQVVLADFQKNERVIIYTYIEDEAVELKNIWLKYSSNAVGNMALFTNNVADNKVVVDLINGEFNCRPYIETVNIRLAPESGKYIKYTCSNGIPASFGRFTGIIVVYLKHQLTPEEYDQIKSISRSLATNIFEKDLNK